MNRQLADLPVQLAGCGSLGSATALLLAKAGARNMYLFDGDLVEPHNVANQLFCDFHVGIKKVEALHSVLKALTGVRARYRSRPLRFFPMAEGVAITAVDNMDARQMLFTDCPAELFIDGRVGGQVLRVYFVPRDDREARNDYEKTLYRDDEASADPCFAASSVHTCWTAAALIASGIFKFCAGEPLPREVIFDHKTLICTYH